MKKLTSLVTLLALTALLLLSCDGGGDDGGGCPYEMVKGSVCSSEGHECKVRDSCACKENYVDCICRKGRVSCDYDVCPGCPDGFLIEAGVH